MSISVSYPSISSTYTSGSTPGAATTSTDPTAINTSDNFSSSGATSTYDPSQYGITAPGAATTDPTQVPVDPTQAASVDPSQAAASSTYPASAATVAPSPLGVDPTQAQPPVVSVPVNNYPDPTQSTAPSQPAVDPTQAAPTLPQAPAGQPVSAKVGGGMIGTLGGAAAGGFLSWKFLLPMIAKGKSPAGMLIAGVVGVGAAIGGWLGHKLFK